MKPRPTSHRWSPSPCTPTTWNALSNPSRWICSSKASWNANRAHEARRASKCFVHDFPHSSGNSNLNLSLNSHSTMENGPANFDLNFGVSPSGIVMIFTFNNSFGPNSYSTLHFLTLTWGIILYKLHILLPATLCFLQFNYLPPGLNLTRCPCLSIVFAKSNGKPDRPVWEVPLTMSTLGLVQTHPWPSSIVQP